MVDEAVTFAHMGKLDQAKVRKEMLRQVRIALKGSRMSAGQRNFAARKMVDQAITKEMQHGND